ncbi:PREDICTED: BPS1 [Prunus dulcis]|uniref:PREDICTED: BPS1 n=1 Tax=Prunus dulcis TaxID=3755 RepID=A0A5E4EIB4_PRUDU|nr:PREDICTED: BPS1 [Prunus dulcis]
MYLTEISNFSSFSPFRVAKKHSVPNNLDLISRSFDDALLCRLKTLTPPSISLSWLSKAVDFLALAQSEARVLISNLKVAALDDSLAWYLDDSVKLLDLCNSVSADIERFRQRRLLLTFVLHLLGDGNQSPEKLRRASKALSDFERCASDLGKRSNAEVLVRDLATGLRNVPRGKASSVGKLVRRTVHAVGLVTVFVAGGVVATIHGSPEMVRVGVPAEFSWAESLNELESEVSAELKRQFGGEKDKKQKGLLEELEDVGTRVREVCEVIDDLAGVAVEEEEEKKRLIDVVKELERATGSFSDGLERLSNGVNEMFNVVLCNRNHMLEKVRERERGVGPKAINKT